MVPTPALTSLRSSSLPHSGHSTRGRWIQVRQLPQRWNRSSLRVCQSFHCSASVVVTSIVTPGSSSALEDGDTAVSHVTPARDDTSRGIVDLRGAGGASQLPDGLDDVIHPEGMRLRQQAAVGVHGERSAKADPAVLDEVPAFPPGTHAELLDLLDHLEGEAVVDLGKVHV